MARAIFWSFGGGKKKLHLANSLAGVWGEDMASGKLESVFFIRIPIGFSGHAFHFLFM